jgi:adenosylmethionine-8-amino-7-oxononanoate aminotransferase
LPPQVGDTAENAAIDHSLSVRRPSRDALENRVRQFEASHGCATRPESMGLRVFEETRRRGVLIGKGGLWGNIIRIGPPFIASKSDVDEFIVALDSAFASL